MITKLFRNYLDALNEGSLEKVLSLFDPGAIVVSPLYGKMSAVAFYEDLFADTNRSETKLIHVFKAVDDPLSAALQFNYTWTLQGGKKVVFECVDVFELTPGENKIAKLTIIYDTALVRSVFDENRLSTSADTA